MLDNADSIRQTRSISAAKSVGARFTTGMREGARRENYGTVEPIADLCGV